jgi:hypothetical protein
LRLVLCSKFSFSLSLFSMLLLSSDHSKKGERERESRRKEICVQITQNSLFAYTRRFLFFFLSLLLLLHCFYLFLLVLIVSNFGSTKIYNCDRLAHTGRNMFVNQSVSFSLEKHHVMSLFFNMFSYYLPPFSLVFWRGLLLFCSNDE